jgi:hypothetical protein
MMQALAGRISGCAASTLVGCAGQVEALAANLASINRRYKARAGLQVAGI